MNGRNVTELILLAGMANSPLEPRPGYSAIRPELPDACYLRSRRPCEWRDVPVGWRDPQRCGNNLNLPLPFPGCAAGVQGRDQRIAGAVRASFVRCGQCGDEVRHQRFSRRCFRIRAERHFQRQEFLRARTRQLEAEPIRRSYRRTDHEEQALLLRWLSGHRQALRTSATLAYVPSPAMLAGDFTAFASPACNDGRQITLPAAQGFVNNQISPTRFDPAALKISRYLPTPTRSMRQSDVWAICKPGREISVSRLDYIKSNKQSLFGRFFFAHLTEPSTYDGKNLLTITAIQPTIGSIRLLWATRI